MPRTVVFGHSFLEIAGIGPWTHCGQTSHSGVSTIAEGWAQMVWYGGTTVHIAKELQVWKGTSVTELETAQKNGWFSCLLFSFFSVAKGLKLHCYPRQDKYKYKVAVGHPCFEDLDFEGLNHPSHPTTLSTQSLAPWNSRCLARELTFLRCGLAPVSWRSFKTKIHEFQYHFFNMISIYIYT